MEMEIIYISSDESDSQKENKKKKAVTNCIEIVKTCHGKIEILSSDDEKIEENSLKRKMIDKEEAAHKVEKKMKLNISRDIPKVITVSKSEVGLISVPGVSPVVKLDMPKKDQEETIERPKLIVKEKKRISYITHDIFPLFISLCIQNTRGDEKKDMAKIVNKLKRRYEDLDPDYAISESFALFLNEKREAIVNNNKRKYVHIEEVMNEMKKRIKKKPKAAESYDAVPSTSYATNNLTINGAIEINENNNEKNANPKIRRKIRQLTSAMKKCEATIKGLEEAEVDFNEDNDSNYIKLERYKQRMVELYNKYCELTGENTDAGRVYLRPKHLNLTRMSSVDHAITNFINSKITQRNRVKKIGALTNDLIFPDYRDILECVTRCNNKNNIGLDKRSQEQLAKKAFRELGDHLQRSRQNDYWDTFSLYLENTGEDPAMKDQDLAKKLADNRTEGEKRLAAVFEKYAKKQEEMKEQDNADETGSEEEEEDEEDEEKEEEEEEEEGEGEEEDIDKEKEESIINDDDKSKNKLPVISLSDESNDLAKDKIVKENKSPVENGRNNINTVNVKQNIDISSKTSAHESQEKCNKKIKIVSMQESNAVSKSQTKTAGEKIHEMCTKNSNVNPKVQEDSLPSSTADCTSDINRIEEDLGEAGKKDVSKVVIGPTKEATTKGAADKTTRNVANVISKAAENAITDIIEVIVYDQNEVKTANKTRNEEITEDKAAIENISNNNQSEEEKKPVLRLRSFAKPPTTWEDKMDKVQETAPKVANEIEEVDLTNEAATVKPSTHEPTVKPTLPVVTKCTVKVGDKVVPLVKRQTLVIPPNSNIINVQNIKVNNIMRNYLKVNTRTGQIIAPVRDIRGSTIIRLPSVPTNRQNQQQNANAASIRQEVPLTGNGTLVRIIQPKSVVFSKKTVQAKIPISKQQDGRSSATKPK